MQKKSPIFGENKKLWSRKYNIYLFNKVDARTITKLNTKWGTSKADADFSVEVAKTK